MTSKISSVKLLKEAMKRSAAPGIFLLIGFFCYYPVIGMMFMNERWLHAVKDTKQYINELNAYGVANPILFCVTFGAALLLGIMQFSYLHSAEKVDFYHSIPVRREKIFGIRYAAGVLVWLVPFAVNLMLFVCICAVKGFAVTEGTMPGASLPALLAKGLIAHIVCFLLVYSLTILAMMVTGKIFAAIAAMFVFCGYVPAIKILQEVLMDFYFATYYGSPDLGNSLAIQCTPVYAYIRVCGDLMNQVFPLDLLIAIVLISALICGLCLYLYRMRASEKAGRPMAFHGIARVVKFLLVVPVTLICTVCFYFVTGNNILWEIFGLIFSLLLISGIIEFIYRMDIREMFRDKKQIALSGVVTLAILAVFQFDLTGFDSWMPEKTEVESADIRTGYMLADKEKMEYEQLVTGDGTVVLSMRKPEDYGTRVTIGYGITDLDTVFQLVEHSTSFSGEMASEMGDYWDYSYSISVTWHLKDGTQKVRGYEFTRENLQEYMAPLWETEEYRLQSNPALSVEPEDVLAIFVAPSDVSLLDAISLKSPAADDAAADDEEAGNARTETTAESEKAESAQTENIAEYAEEAMTDAGLLTPDKPLTNAQMETLTKTVFQDLREETLAEALTYADWNLQIIYRGQDGRVYGQSQNLNGGFADTITLLREYGYPLAEEAA